MRDKRGIMPRKPYYIFSICAVVIFMGGCPFHGRAYEEDLSNGYAVWAADVIEDAVIVRKKDKEHSYSTRVVQPTVFAYGWNDDFIIAKQHPNKDRKVDTSLTYWYIVEVASGDVHGPLSEDEFDKLRIKLKVPPDLSFKTIQ